MMRVIADDRKVESVEGFAEEVASASGQDIEACYQCGKCTAGCPLALAMDRKPNQVIRAVQLGFRDMALDSAAIWYCAGCETCASRCPRDIDMSRVMKSLARLCVKEGHQPRDPAVAAFHKSFLESMARWGRAHEVEVIGLTKLRAASQRLKDLPLGAALFGKGKLALMPHRLAERSKVRDIISADDVPAEEISEDINDECPIH